MTATAIDLEAASVLSPSERCLAYLAWCEDYVSTQVLQQFTGSNAIKTILWVHKHQRHVVQNNHGAWKLAPSGQRWCATHLRHVIQQRGETV
jgi:hypothetical protein